MKADPAAQLSLLALQELDTHIQQVRHKRAHLPAKARVTELSELSNKVRKELIAAETIVGDLERERLRADADVDVVRERSRKDQELLDSGAISDPKQLQSLQSELESLAKRRSALEDVELEIMERIDGAEAAVRQLTEQSLVVQSDLDQATVEFAEADDALAAEEAELVKDRAQRAETLPTDLLALYEKVRGDHGGVGAAPLRRGRCEGCHLELAPTDIAEIAAAPVDEVVRCEECRRILVRTAESGLPS